MHKQDIKKIIIKILKDLNNDSKLKLIIKKLIKDGFFL